MHGKDTLGEFIHLVIVREMCDVGDIILYMLADPKDCDQAILDMRKAVKKVKHLYEKVCITCQIQ